MRKFTNKIVALFACVAALSPTLGMGPLPLHAAVRLFNTHAAEELLDQNTEVNARDYAGATPLQIATADNHTRMMKLLLTHNANPEAVVRRNKFVSFKGWARREQLLPEQIAKILTRPCCSFRGMTPLQIAAACDHARALRLLLTAGAEFS